MRIFLAGLAFLLSVQASPAADPVCALIDTEQSLRTAIVEAKLLAAGGTTWVERTEVEKALKEQQLQALYGPVGGGRRVALGRILKADVLVLVRTVKDQNPAVTEVIVCETAGGLRLLSGSAVQTADSSTDAAALLAVARGGIARSREPVREVIAVPSFTSHDLENRFSHLQAAYAKLIETAALTRPGVVAVELAEANAIAAELRLAAPGATVRRRAPLYLQGDYQNADPGQPTAVKLTLRATRNGKPEGQTQEQTVKPEEAPAVLRAWVLARLGAADAGPGDSVVEAKELAVLAIARMRVGHDEEGIALYEASLLLNPKQPRIRAEAMAAIRILLDRKVVASARRGANKRVESIGPSGLKRVTTYMDTGHGPRIADLNAAREIDRLHRRGWDHMEALVRSRAKPEQYKNPAQTGLFRGYRWFDSMALPYPDETIPYSLYHGNLGLFPHETAGPELIEVYETLLRDRRAAAARLLPLVVEDAQGDELEFLKASVSGLPAPERYEELGRLLLRFQDSPAVTAAARKLLDVSPAVPAFWEDIKQIKVQLDKLAKEGNAALKESVEAARRNIPFRERNARYFERQKAKGEQKEAEREATPVSEERPKYADAAATLDKSLGTGAIQRLQLKVSNPEDAWLLESLGGCIATGPATDVVWDGRSGGVVLSVMKVKGVLKPIWRKSGSFLRVQNACFDGKYVWFALGKAGGGTLHLVVLDPVAEKVYGVEEGLPNPLGEAVFAALEPGKICLAGYVRRTWIATVTFDSIRGVTKGALFHTARELHLSTDETQWEKTSVAFKPTYVSVLRGEPGPDGKPPRRVLIGRGSGGWNPVTGHGHEKLFSHPLLADPDTGTVEVMRDELHLNDVQTAVANRGLYLLELREKWPKNTGFLRRVEFPGVIRDVGPAPMADGGQFSDTRLWITGDQLRITRWHYNHSGAKKVELPPPELWTADPSVREFRKTTIPNVPITWMGTSAHYGPIARVRVGTMLHWSALCTVDAPAPGAARPVPIEK